jgi:hypothetical protein
VRSQPVVNAIRRFSEERGRAPKDLQELVPGYLPEVPRTGMPACPAYKYVAGEDGDCYGNPWALFVNTLCGALNFDMFVYFPLQNYPRYGYGGSLERVGEWAYVHE